MLRANQGFLWSDLKCQKDCTLVGESANLVGMTLDSGQWTLCSVDSDDTVRRPYCVFLYYVAVCSM